MTRDTPEKYGKPVKYPHPKSRYAYLRRGLELANQPSWTADYSGVLLAPIASTSRREAAEIARHNERTAALDADLTRSALALRRRAGDADFLEWPLTPDKMALLEALKIGLSQQFYRAMREAGEKAPPVDLDPFLKDYGRRAIVAADMLLRLQTGRYSQTGLLQFLNADVPSYVNARDLLTRHSLRRTWDICRGRHLKSLGGFAIFIMARDKATVEGLELIRRRAGSEFGRVCGAELADRLHERYDLKQLLFELMQSSEIPALAAA